MELGDLRRAVRRGRDVSAGGARFGPRAIRMESLYVKRYSLTHEVDVCDVMSIADAGMRRSRRIRARRTRSSSSILRRGWADRTRRCLRSAATTRSRTRTSRPRGRNRANRRRGWGLCTLMHLIPWMPWGEKWGHASVFQRAMEDGLIDPKRMVSIGIRGPLNTRDDVDGAKKLGITVVTAEDSAPRA